MDYQLESIYEWAYNLLILEYRNAPKNRALIKKLVDLIFANNILLQIRHGFDIETAQSAQLNVIAKWVGIDRYYTNVDIWKHPYLSLISYAADKTQEYDSNQGGFSQFTTIDENNGGFLTYQEWINTRTTVNEIGDEYFRDLIKLKIIKNNINFTMKNIDEAIYKWSNGQVYTTWNNMEVIYHYPHELNDLIVLAVYKDVLPVPTGCTLTVEEI